MTEALETRPDVRNFTPEEKEAASQTRSDLNCVLDSIEGAQKGLETDFVKLGTLLTKIQESRHWILYGFKSYNDFLASIEGKVKKGRTHLYACAKIAAQLLPIMDEGDLITTGISKASALASAVKKSGKAPSDELLASAKDPTVTTEKLEQLIGGELGTRDDLEDGLWFSLVGCFFSDEEREEFKRAVSVACRVDPALPHVIDWRDANAVERKDVLQRWIREFLGTWESQVERGEG